MGITIYKTEISKKRDTCKRCGHVILPGEPMKVGIKQPRYSEIETKDAYETSNGWYSKLCRKCCNALNIK